MDSGPQKTLKAIESVNGEILVYLQGILFHAVDAIKLEKNDKICLDIITFPEGVKKGVKSLTLQKINSNDISYGAVCSLGYRAPLTWSAHQRQVGYIKVVAIVESLSKSKTSRRVVGESILDLATLVASSRKIISCCLPLAPTGSDSLFRIQGPEENEPQSNYDNLTGWLIAAFKFIPSDDDSSNNFRSSVSQDPSSVVDPLKVLESLSTERWNTCVKDPALLTYPVNIHTDKLVSVHIGLGEIDVEDNAVRKSFLESDVNSILKIQSNIGNAKETQCHIENKTFVQSDMILTAFFMLDFAILLEISVSWKDTMICNGIMLIPKDLLLVGYPINVLMPLRDLDGKRIAVLKASFQIPGSSASSLASVVEDKRNESSNNLMVRIDTGSISDPNWKLKVEPFFECSIQSHSADIPSDSIRTSFVKSDSDTQPWNLSCMVPFPENLTNNMDASSLREWSLLIVCRDAARPGCPDIGWTRMAIPAPLIFGGKAVEMWLVLSPPADGTNRAQNAPGGSRGRVKVRLEKGSELQEESSSGGVGVVMIWLQNIMDSKLKDMSALSNIVATTASLHVLTSPSDHQVDYNSDVPARAITSCDIMPLRLGPVPSAGYQFGNLLVPGSNTEVHLEVTTQNAQVLQGAFPVLAAAAPATQASGESLGGKPSLGNELNLLMSYADSKINSKTRIPRLKLTLCYVPFVQGKLYITYGDVKVYSSASQQFSGNQLIHNCVLRFSLGTTMNCFSTTFDVYSPTNQSNDGLKGISLEELSNMLPPAPSVTQSVAIGNLSPTASTAIGGKASLGKNKLSKASAFSKPSGPPGKPKSRTRPMPQNKLKSPSSSAKPRDIEVLEVNVDTYDVLWRQCVRSEVSGGGTRQLPSMDTIAREAMDMHVRLLDLSAGGSGDDLSHFYFGVGCLNIATLFQQAARKALSTGITGATDKSNMPGCSPWMKTAVELYDPMLGRPVACVPIGVQFAMDCVPAAVRKDIHAAKENAGIDDIQDAKFELGLKQVFQYADKDHCGSICSSEVSLRLNIYFPV